jgi:CHAT domain-containing protein/Tfp pilus assembly protein PilF
LRALGLVALDLEGTREAIEHLRAAVAAARRAGSSRRRAEARMSLAHALANDGQSAAALRQAGLAMGEEAAREDGRLTQQHAMIIERLGRLDEALERYRHALVLVRRTGDAYDEFTVLINRGIVQIYRGALRAAEADLLEAEALARRIGQPLHAAFSLGNLGLVATLRGDLPGALECFDAAAPVLAKASETRWAIMELDRCAALLAAGLHAEAHASAGAVVAVFAGRAMRTDLAEARLTLAEAALASGDTAAAIAAAEQAGAEFAAQRRPGWSALSESVAVRAAFTGGRRDAALRIRARRAADALDGAGRPAAALDARVLAARVALAIGAPREAARDLEPVARARRRGPVGQRLAAWHAEALRRLASGERASALRALRAGLAVLDAHRVSLGATELRTAAAVHGNALTALGLRLAIASGRAASVLEWGERGRAGALWQRPARPPGDAELARDLGELRTVLAAIVEAGKESGETQRLLRRQAELEAAVRRRARHAAGCAAGEQWTPPSAARLRGALGSRVLVEYVQDAGQLHAVVATWQALRLRRLDAGVGEVARELTALRFALRKLGRGSASAASAAVARANAEHAAGRLDALLLAPLRDVLGDADRELVLVPTGELHAMPWPALASCAARAVSVAPSAALWLRAAERRVDPARSPEARPPSIAVAPAAPRGELAAEASGGPPPSGAPSGTRPAAGAASGALLLAAGPGLPHAEAEVRALAGRHHEATALLGAGASVDAVAAALETATRAHIASHGSFRADNPLFSSLQLADGPLTVYDLERLGATPLDMILSACDGGVTAVRPGDELMGFSGALLALGTSALLASVIPVPDEPTHRLMLALHEQLAAGSEPAAALAQARAAALTDADADYATAAGFVCFGAGSAASAGRTSSSS